jgi:histidinol dehydrogenase
LIVRDRDGLVAVANQLAAEHVAVHTADARALADRILRAGAIFVGAMTPEAAGDYLAGPSHVLPTGGAARYGAPLGVYDFVSRTSIIDYEASALIAQSPKITAFARAEGLEAHARAVEYRTLRGR